MSSNVDIPPRAVAWICAVLRDEAPPAPYFYLGCLKVPQLKKICTELKARTLQIHTNSLVSSATQGQIVVFIPPKSYAKKAEFVLAISTYFNTHGTSNNNFYDLLNGRTNVLAGAGSTTSSVPSVVNVPSHLVIASTFPTTNPPVAQAVRTSLSNVSTNTPSAAVGAKKLSPTKKSPLKTTNTSSLPNATVGQGPTALHSTATTADAMHRSFYNQLHQNNISHLPHQSTLPTWNNLSHAASAISGTTSVHATGGGVKRAITSLSPIRSAGLNHLPSNVKRQALSLPSTTQPNHSSTYVRPAAASSTEDDSDKPRDFRENSMLASLRQMGFANTVEILTALRAVAAQRAEKNRVGCNQWTQHEQVDAAMTWIVTQREEAEFARALDAARILSEQENAVQEQNRKQQMAQELNHANMNDLLGATDEGLATTSKHFPHSVLLRNRSVRSVLKSVASGSSLGKAQVIRLLNLELKARKWYGTVLPFSYFEYVLCPSFGSWAGMNATDLCQKVQQVSDELEHAMYNLSEQVEGGIGSVPKLFFDAQAKSSKEGKPISAPEDAEVIIDDEVEVVEKSIPSSSACAGVLELIVRR